MSRLKFGRRRVGLLSAQLAILLVLLAAWQWLPKIDVLSRRYRFLDPFFISSPQLIVKQLDAMIRGEEGTPQLVDFLIPTLKSAAAGAFIGVLLGAVAGLLFANFRLLHDLFMPFVAAANAVPRIAMIPILILLFGISFKATVASAVLVVFFVVFFNALEGGLSVPLQMVQNARLLGASEWKVMRTVRLPYVLAWTMAALPNAATFSLLAVVTAEVLTGYKGLGQLLGAATSTLDASLTFAIVVVLSAVGVIVVGLLQIVKKRVLHWW
jgi:NitT/TauT family transport system permease protein